jgi:hypothetical protein
VLYSAEHCRKYEELIREMNLPEGNSYMAAFLPLIAKGMFAAADQPGGDTP